MYNSKIVFIAVAIAANFAVQKVAASEAGDIRKFGLEFPHNKQDENDNTFWHRLAQESKDFNDWGQVIEKEKIFKENNNNWLPNPFIENKHGNTARKEAKSIFKQTGNPVTVLLIVHLRQLEDGYADKMAAKQNREFMAVVQKYENPHK